MPEEERNHRLRGLLVTLVTLTALGLVGLFALRVTVYAELIRTGQLRPQDLAFLSAYTPSSIAASLAAGGDKVDGLDKVDDPSLGSPDAAVTIVEFADFGCPFSRDSAYVVRALASEYGDKIRVVYRDFPIVELHPDAERAAEAGKCAAEQGKFWEFHDKMYQNQSDLSESRLLELAREANLNEAAMRSCLDSHREQPRVAADYQAGIDAGVAGTPTFFINGTRIPGSIPEDVLKNLIDQALKPSV